MLFLRGEIPFVLNTRSYHILEENTQEEVEYEIKEFFVCAATWKSMMMKIKLMGMRIESFSSVKMQMTLLGNKIRQLEGKKCVSS